MSNNSDQPQRPWPLWQKVVFWWLVIWLLYVVAIIVLGQTGNAKGSPNHEPAAGAWVRQNEGVASPATFKGRNGLIAYSTWHGEDIPSVVATLRPDGTRHRVLLRRNKHYLGGPFGPEWSRDGKLLLFGGHIGRYNGTKGDSLWYATASGNQVRRIPLGFRFAASLNGYGWAPDGRHLVFAIERQPDRSTVYTINIDGTHRKALGRGSLPEWSNDGRHIVFARTLGAVSRISVTHPDGSGRRRLTSGDNDWSPSFSPDGRKVVFVRNYAALEGYEWRVVDVTGRNDVLVSTHGGVSEFYCPPRWSPDGTRLAAIRRESVPGTNRSVAAFVTVKPDGTNEHVAFTFADRTVEVMCEFSWQSRH